MSRQIVVDIIGDSSGFNKAVDSASGKAGGLKGILGGIGAGIGLGIFSLATDAIGGLTDALGDSAAAFREDQASQSLLQTALANNIPGWDGNTAAIEANISAQQAKGVSDSMQREGMVALLNKTHDLTAATDLSNAAIELAAGTGKTYEEAIAEITSGLNGKVAALNKDGIAVTKNSTAAEIATAIMNQYAGSQDKVAETSEGKMKISQEKVGEAMEKVGAVIDKVAQVALPILADAFVTIIGVVTDVIATISPVIDEIMPHLQNAVTVVGNVFNTVFPIIRTVVETVFGAIGTAIGIFQTVLDTAAGVVRSVVGTMTGLFNGLASVVGTVFNGIAGAIRGALNSVIDIINGAIGAINGISFRIDNPLGGDPLLNFTGLNLPTIPRLHKGGIVPGVPGTEVPILALAGEVVTPRGGGSAPSNVTLNATFNVSGSGNPEDFGRRALLSLRRELTRNGMSLA